MDERPPFLSLGVTLLFLGAIVTGFYTMVVYAISMVTGWQAIVCGS